MRTGLLFIIVLTIVSVLISSQLTARAEKYKILVVMSYEKDNPWCQEIKEGIESVLAEHADVTYFYMDTKINIAGGKAKAEEAFQHLQKLHPDGIIAVDDNAQSMFVVPYLKDRSTIPIMFCGVNSDPEKYGYPTSYISGVLERGHIMESIALAKQLSSRIERIGFFAKDSPSGRALEKQVQQQKSSFVAKVSSFDLLKTEQDLVDRAIAHNEISDAVFIDSLVGTVSQKGVPLNNKQIIDIISKNFRKPIIGANLYHVKEGALCAVVKTGQEQGGSAASMLYQALQGKPVSEMPITRNYKGRRIINVKVLKELGIQPNPLALFGSVLIK